MATTERDEGYRKRLTPEEYRILRERGTETAGSGAYRKTKTRGVYSCKACGNKVFESATKYDSGSGCHSMRLMTLLWRSS
jgi:peptide-methionine (R)-S-oxide reductase